jgi:hypothetical protein
VWAGAGRGPPAAPGPDPPAQADQLNRAAFRALVDAQDRGLSVPASRKAVAKKFDWSEDDVRAVEEEGLTRGWPPL